MTTNIVGGDERAYGVAVSGDRIFVGGYVYAGATGYDFAVACYRRSDGSLDTSFDVDGIARTNVAGSDDRGYALAVQDGKVIVAGYAYSATTGNDFAMVRYTTAGAVDFTATADFSGGDDRAFALALSSDQIVLAGYATATGANKDFAIARFTTNGVLNGKTTTNLGSNYDQAYAVAVDPNDPDQRIVAAGTTYQSGTGYDFALVRYNADGTLDNNFHGDGKVTTSFSTGTDWAYSLVIQPADQSIMVAGYTSNGSNIFDFVLARYGSDGNLDTSFGQGGKVVTGDARSFDEAWALAVQPDGKVIVAGETLDGGYHRFGMARYGANGSLDAETFGTEGRVVDSSNATAGIGYAVAVDETSGAIFMAGTVSSNFALAKYNSAGQLVTAFGSGGSKLQDLAGNYDCARSVVLRPDGKILVAGYAINGTASYDFALAQFNADGSLDTSFGDDRDNSGQRDGIKLIDGPSGFDYGYKLLLQADGKILFAGALYSSTQAHNFALLRFEEDGDLDPAFGDQGKLVLDWNGSTDQAYDVALQGEKILVAGYSYHPTRNYDFAVARYALVNSVWQLDTTFGTGGKAWADFGGADIAYAMAVEADGKIVLAGSSYNGATDDFALVRFTADGVLDNTFGQSGKMRTDLVGGFESIRDIDILPGGDLVVAGPGWSGTNYDFSVARYFGEAGGLKVSVQNVAPTLSIDGAATIQEGSTYTLNLSASDPGTDTISEWEIDWGDGYIEPVTGSPSTVQHVYADGPATHRVRATATDGDGTYSVGTPGTLNAAFGERGFAQANFSNGSDFEYAMARQADGKLVSVGYGDDKVFRVVRQNSDGSPDTTFGTNGVVKTAIGMYADARGVAIQSDKKIVVAGSTYTNSNGYDYAVARYNTDGSLDTSFGGDGIVTTNIVGGDERAYGVAVYGDRIFVGGYVYAGATGYDFAVACYDASDGDLDTTFDLDGIARTNVAGSDDRGYALTVQTDGKVVVAGYAYSAATSYDFAVVRYNTNGSVDFQATADQSSGDDRASAVVLSGGNIVLAGYATRATTGKDFALTQFTTAGQLDTTSFGTAGWAVTDLGGNYDQAYAVAIDTQNPNDPTRRIVVAGTSYQPTGTGYDFALVRYHADGTLDTDFHGDGKVTTSFSASSDAAYSLVIQPADQSIMVAGYTANSTSGFDFILARYGSNGSLDTSFGQGTGKVVTGDARSFDEAWALAVQPDGKVIVAGETLDGYSHRFAMARYDANGSLDAETFGTEGRVMDSSNATAGIGYAVAVDETSGAIFMAGTVSSNFALAKYDSAGQLVTTFGSGGSVLTDLAGSYDCARSVVVRPKKLPEEAGEPTGKILVAGYALNGTASYDFALAQFNADGSLDTSFGDDRDNSGQRDGIKLVGYSANDYGYKLLLQDDGKVLLAGALYTQSYDFALLRFEEDGDLDLTFGDQGKLVLDWNGSTDQAYDVALQGEKILVAGYSYHPTRNYDFAVVRYNLNGSLDDGGADDVTPADSFGTGGKAYADFGGSDIAYAMAVEADGKIVLAGSSYNGATDDFALVRFTADGVLDTTFGQSGKVRTDLVGGFESIRDIAILPGGDLVVAGPGWSGTSYDFSVARYFGEEGGLKVTVENVAPQIRDREDQTAFTGFLFTSDSAFVDPGFNNAAAVPTTSETFTYTVDWGDGTPLDTGTSAGFFGGCTGESGQPPARLTQGYVRATHTYEVDDDYQVTVTVYDDDGASDVSDFTVHVSQCEPPYEVTAAPSIEEGERTDLVFTRSFGGALEDIKYFITEGTCGTHVKYYGPGMSPHTCSDPDDRFTGSYFVHFTSDQMTQRTEIVSVEDNYPEYDVSVSVSLEDPRFGPDRTSVLIKDDDRYRIAISHGHGAKWSGTAPEYGPPIVGYFVVSRDNSRGELTIPYDVVPNAQMNGIQPASPGLDYDIPGLDYESLSGSVTFHDGECTVQIPVIPLRSQSSPGGPETCLVRIALRQADNAPTGLPWYYLDSRVGNFWLGEIGLPEERWPEVDVFLSANPDTREGGPQGLFALSVELDDETYFDPEGDGVDLSYAFSGTATYGLDYTARIYPSEADIQKEGHLVLEGHYLIEIFAVNDAIFEGDESVVLTIDRPWDDGGYSPESATMVIHDVDQPNHNPQFNFAPIVDAYVNQPFVDRAIAYDDDDTRLVYGGSIDLAGVLSPAQDNFRVAADGQITWTPSAALAGREYDVTLTVDDVHGEPTQLKYRIRVHPEPGNHAPVFTSEPSPTFYLPPEPTASEDPEVDPKYIVKTLDEEETASVPVTVTLPPDIRTSDIIFVVDESDSMTVEHDWLESVITQVDAQLNAKGIVNNRYALMGYAYYDEDVSDGDYHFNRGIVYGPHWHYLDGTSQVFGTAEEVQSAAQGLDSVGGCEDGYGAVLAAIAPQQPSLLRPGVPVELVLVTNEVALDYADKCQQLIPALRGNLEDTEDDIFLTTVINGSLKYLPTPLPTKDGTENFERVRGEWEVADQDFFVGCAEQGQYAVARYQGSAEPAGNDFVKISGVFTIDAVAGPGDATAVFIFDYHDDRNFRYFSVSAGSDQLHVGRFDGQWHDEQVLSATIDIGVEYCFSFWRLGDTASVKLVRQSDQAEIGYFAVTGGFGTGDFGLGVIDSTVSFDDYWTTYGSESEAVTCLDFGKLAGGALGVDSSGAAYVATGNGGFVRSTRGEYSRIQAPTSTVKRDYVQPAWLTGGSVWDLERLHSANVDPYIGDSFSAAFADSMGRQVIGQLIHVEADAICTVEPNREGAPGSYFVTLTGDGRSHRFDIRFMNGSTELGRIPVAVAGAYRYELAPWIPTAMNLCSSIGRRVPITMRPNWMAIEWSGTPRPLEATRFT